MPEIANIEQAAQWDGPTGDAWVTREDALNASLAAHAEHLLAAADLSTTDRVLDVGCGTGDTTRSCAQRATEGRVLGVDLSSAMLARARQRADALGLTNAEFQQADAQVHPFTASSFDLVISRFGVMFFADPLAAFTNLARATARDGRLALIVWQDPTRNEWVSLPRAALTIGRDLPPVPHDVPGPFGLADPERVRRILAGAGWSDVHLDDVAVPFFFGADADVATRFAAEIGTLRAAFEGLDAADTRRALESLHTELAARASADGVVLESRAWIVTAVR